MFYVTLSIYFCSTNIGWINLIYWTLLYTNLIALTLWFGEELENFMWQVFKLNLASFVMQQNWGEEMFFEEEEKVIGFFFNQLVNGVVYKPLRAEEQRLRWWINEGDVV
jgi:hypothetical protein